MQFTPVEEINYNKYKTNYNKDKRDTTKDQIRKIESRENIYLWFRFNCSKFLPTMLATL